MAPNRRAPGTRFNVDNAVYVDTARAGRTCPQASGAMAMEGSDPNHDT
ncbi:MAG TPA: hypothetical protein VF720_05145 [Candidatus Eisenbacteria bacterium]